MKRVRSKPAFQNVGARGFFENSNNSLPPLAGSQSFRLPKFTAKKYLSRYSNHDLAIRMSLNRSD